MITTFAFEGNVVMPKHYFLVGVTGRLVEYPKDLLEEAREDLMETLSRTARMSLASDFPISEIEKLQGYPNQGCALCSSPEESQ